jgi:hypothetical protein
MYIRPYRADEFRKVLLDPKIRDVFRENRDDLRQGLTLTHFSAQPETVSVTEL